MEVTDAALGGAFNTTGRSNADGLTDDWDVTRPHINPLFSSVVLDDPEMVGTWDGPNPEPDTNYFRELNLESLAHILRCLESKEIGVVSIVCREFNTVLMGRNGAAGFTIRCVEKKTRKKWGDPKLTTLTRLDLDYNSHRRFDKCGRIVHHECGCIVRHECGRIVRHARCYFGLISNQITDIKPLQDLTALTNLGLCGNPITDIKPLQDLTALTSLALHEIRHMYMLEKYGKNVLDKAEDSYIMDHSLSMQNDYVKV